MGPWPSVTEFPRTAQQWCRTWCAFGRHLLLAGAHLARGQSPQLNLGGNLSVRSVSTGRGGCDEYQLARGGAQTAVLAAWFHADEASFRSNGTVRINDGQQRLVQLMPSDNGY